MNKMKRQISEHGRDSVLKPKGEMIDSDWQPFGEMSQRLSHWRWVLTNKGLCFP